MDDFIVKSFNIYDPDPVYVFVLPGNDANQTLVFRRSDFSEITFPNMTSLQRLQKLLKNSQIAFSPTNDDDQQSRKQLFPNQQKFLAKYKHFLSDNAYDSDEAESLKVIEENVRTEKNFFKFMDKLNDGFVGDEVNRFDDIENDHELESRSHKYRTTTDYRALIRTLHSREHIGSYELANKHTRITRPLSDKITWDDFGLNGWVGNINMEHRNPDENG